MIINNIIIAPFGAKGIAVATGATLDLHGYNNGPSWTRLSVTAKANSTSVLVEDAVKWVAGDILSLILSSSLNSIFFPFFIIPFYSFSFQFVFSFLISLIFRFVSRFFAIFSNSHMLTLLLFVFDD